MELEIFANPEILAHAAATQFTKLSQIAVQERGKFSVSLAGGQTPKRVYELLASDEFKNQIDWSRVYVFFGDERTVPPYDPRSNYGMVKETLLSRVPLPTENIHRLKGEGNPQENASAYERTLRSFFTTDAWPRFDLVFLGLGEDGHTASLFPGSEALTENNAWVVANGVAKLEEFRLTLTAPAINAASVVVFLVTGASKAKILAEVLKGPEDLERLPAQLIKPHGGQLIWLTDAAAAVQLDSEDQKPQR